MREKFLKKGLIFCGIYINFKVGDIQFVATTDSWVLVGDIEFSQKISREKK